MFLCFKTLKQCWRGPCEDGKTTGRRTDDVLAELTALLRSRSSSSSQDEAAVKILFTSAGFSRTYRTSGFLAFILTRRSSVLCPRHGGGEKEETFKHFRSSMFPERLLPLIQRLCCHRFSVGLLSNDAAPTEMRIKRLRGPCSQRRIRLLSRRPLCTHMVLRVLI